MNAMSEQETCQKTVRPAGASWRSSHRCGKPVKADGLCGLHLSAKKRRDEGTEKRRAEWAAGCTARELARRQIAALAALGWAAHEGREPGEVVIEDVQRLIETLRGDGS